MGRRKKNHKWGNKPPNNVSQTHANEKSSTHSNNGQLQTKHISMIDILRDKDGFESFVRHCVSEMSVENVLFLVEVAQYRASVLSSHSTRNNNNYKNKNDDTSIMVTDEKNHAIENTNNNTNDNNINSTCSHFLMATDLPLARIMNKQTLPHTVTQLQTISNLLA